MNLNPVVDSRWIRRMGRIGGTLYHGLAVIGLLAVLVSAGGFFGISSTLLISPFDSSGGASGAFSATIEPDPRYRVLADYLSRRYRVANDVTESLVGAAHDAGKKLGLDPILLLAVMAVESRFNPIAESEMGAKGLMQVVPQQHPDKLSEHGGTSNVLNPENNIRIGAAILRDCIRRAGSIEAGLQSYAGALADTSSQYAQKVFAEKDRIVQALRRQEQRSAQQASVVSSPASL